jgi:hypothetical protein
MQQPLPGSRVLSVVVTRSQASTESDCSSEKVDGNWVTALVAS